MSGMSMTTGLEPRKAASEWDALERGSFVPFPETNIASVLLARAEHARFADKVHLIVSPRRGVVEQRLTFSELARQCLWLARALQREGVRRGARVILSQSGDFGFIRTFYACQLLGAIPVPVIPPINRAQVRGRIEQLRAIAGETGARLLVTDRRLHTLMEGGLGAAGALRVVAYEELDGEKEEAPPDVPDPADVSFIQYTSGSTGGRKGVPVTHGHLVTNINGIGRSLVIVPSDVGVSFLPVYHDMGLIGKVLLTACHGNLLCQIPPLSFLRDPAHWLRQVHEHRATVCAAPPFAYGLCTRRIEDGDLDGVDLGSWRIAMAAADMIRPEVLDAFAVRFEARGFRRRAFLPVYGLAEVTLAATMPVLDGPLVTLSVPVGDGATRDLVCVGAPLDGHRVRIASSEGKELPLGVEGEIEILGPSVIDRYWGDTTPRTRDGWLRTGDLGILTKAGLFISGRTKDVIKVHGRSLQPCDIEWAADEVEGVRRGCSAAFNAARSEKVVLVVESRLREDEARAKLASAVRAHVRETLGVEVAEVAVVPPYTVPKTGSGKIRRTLTRERLEANALHPSWRAKAQDLAALAVHVVRGGAARAFGALRSRFRAARWARPEEKT
jgi:fatty-acyl-CoA synthase